ncbi:Non-specific DNA-binding protein Dps / Iron-binding ferritin-like antioxidant protein / Ferroxidase [Halorubrum sp. DM2]|nr:Non-specific DNA-binding protein Dps / Iron-binding ferritin-like antioxidant protein / Ferroxidase [Halorubrum sp. DM2]
MFLQEVYKDVEDAADELAERLQVPGGVSHGGMTTLAEYATVEVEDNTLVLESATQ